MSFWTGFTTGLAGSVDRALQGAMEQDRNELSRAKNFWREIKAQKLDKEQEKKEAYDEKAEKAYNFLADELGDATMAYAVMKKLGGADEALDYVNKVKAKRDTLQANEVYNIRDDFVDYKPGETTLTRDQGMERVRYKMPSSIFAPVKAEDLAVESRIDKLFGREGQAAQQAASTLSKQFAAQAPEKLEPLTGIGTIGRVDTSRLLAAQAAKEKEEDRKMVLEEFDMKKSAFKQNESRITQAMQIERDAEARAAAQADNAIAQEEFQNARQARIDAQTLARVTREAELHILNVRKAKQDIERTDLELLKEKSHPQFKDFEDMYVYATQKLADKGLSGDKRAEYELLRQDAIKGAKAYKSQVDDDTASKLSFSKPNRQTVLNNEIKRILEPKGLITDIQGEIQYKIKGNMVQYFDSMSQALNNVAIQTKDLDDAQMNAMIKTNRDTLKTQRDDYIKEVKNGEKRGKKLYELPDSASAKKEEFKDKLNVGDVVSYKIVTANNQMKIVERIWTGTRYTRGF